MHAHDAAERTDRTDARQPDRSPEADRQEVPHPTTLSPSALTALQRTVGNAEVARMVTRRKAVQRKAIQRSTVPDVVGSPGRPLPEPVRTEMETRLGTDFSDVRVHTDDAARDSAAEIGARAYTSGNHVVLGEGGGDRHTLAHELVHVRQQRQGPVAGADTGHGFQVSDPADRFEREADAVATRALAGPVGTGAPPPAPAEPARSGSAPVQRVPTQDDTRKRKADDGVPEPAPDVEMAEEDYFDSDLSDTEMAGAADRLVGETTEAKEPEQDPALARLEARKAAREEELKAARRAFLQEEAFKKALMGVMRAAEDPRWVVQDWKDNGRTNFRAYAREVKPVPPRSFVGRREVQALTWISTIIAHHLEKVLGIDPQEVQAAIGSNGRLIVSTNYHRTNDRLRSRVADLGDKLLDSLIQENEENQQKYPPLPLTPTGDAYQDGKAEFKNWERERVVEHQEKSRRRLLSRTDPKSGEYEKIHAALEKGVEVPDNDGVEDGLHAERRIARHNRNDQGEEVTPTYLAGTKRPCISCLLALHPDPAKAGVNPGPFFGSAPSNIGFEGFVTDSGDHVVQAETFLKDIVDKLGGVSSFKTLTWDHRDETDPATSFPHEATSESDTDADGGRKPPLKERLRRRRQPGTGT